MKFSILFSLIFCVFSCQTAVVNDDKEEKKALKRYDRPDASILRGVEIPEGASFFFSSGLVAPVLDESAEVNTGERYGDTYMQSVGILNRIKELLTDADLSMSDVVYLRVYLVPDKANNNEVDWSGWFKAYSEFFDNPKNPTKVARTTIAIHSLANPDLLIEVEAVAVYPE
ncbi:RidA family protein [Peijinzhouia sedimentorum]